MKTNMAHLEHLDNKMYKSLKKAETEYIDAMIDRENGADASELEDEIGDFARKLNDMFEILLKMTREKNGITQQEFQQCTSASGKGEIEFGCNILRDRGIVDEDVCNLLHETRKMRNRFTHKGSDKYGTPVNKMSIRQLEKIFSEYYGLFYRASYACALACAGGAKGVAKAAAARPVYAQGRQDVYKPLSVSGNAAAIETPGYVSYGWLALLGIGIAAALMILL